MIGKNKLKTIAVGWANMALKLARVIAQRAFVWLYGCAIYEKIERKPTEKSMNKECKWQAGLWHICHFPYLFHFRIEFEIYLT